MTVAEEFIDQLEYFNKLEMPTITLKDYFAIAVVPPILADKTLRIPDGIEPEEVIATMAYCLADAMMKAREKNNG